MLSTLTRLSPKQRPYLATAASYMTGGSATTQRDATTAAAFATFESKCGHQYIKRVYAGSSYTTFAVSNLASGDYANGASIRTTFLSWNPSGSALVSENTSSATVSGFDPSAGFNAWKAGGYSGTVTGYGTETTKNITALRTIPDYHKIILTPWHEADGYAGTTGYSAATAAGNAEFRAAFRIIADIVHSFGNPTWQVCLLLTAYPFKGAAIGSTQNLPSNFWPSVSMAAPSTGLNYVDVFGIDIYSEGSLDATRWDSFSVSCGVPLSAEEATAYQARYKGTGSVGGWRQSDPNSGLTWTDGIKGWMNAVGITKWAIGEVGVQLNHAGLAPNWTNRQSLTASKSDWIKSMAYTLAEWNADPKNGAKLIAVCWFMSAGRTYAAADYLSWAIHNATTGARVPCAQTAASSGALPTTGNSTGDMAWVPSSAGKGELWQWSGSAWADTGIAAVIESWQLWYDDGDGGWDGATAGWAAWKFVTTTYGADQLLASAGWGASYGASWGN